MYKIPTSSQYACRKYNRYILYNSIIDIKYDIAHSTVAYNMNMNNSF